MAHLLNVILGRMLRARSLATVRYRRLSESEPYFYQFNGCRSVTLHAEGGVLAQAKHPAVISSCRPHMLARRQLATISQRVHQKLPVEVDHAKKV